MGVFRSSATDRESAMSYTLSGVFPFLVKPKPSFLSRHGATLVAVGAAVVVGTAWRYRRCLAYHLSDCASELVENLTRFIASSAEYEPESRVALEGEAHDFTEVEEVEVVVPPKEEGGKATKKRERRVVKKKWEHELLSAGGVNGTYLAEVVMEARLHYNHRAASAYNMSLAKAYMVRVMKAHGMRPAHIAAHIDRMVLAVFVQTDDQVALRDNERVLRAVGRLGGGAEA